MASWIRLDLARVRTLETANVGWSQGVLHPDRVTGYHDLLLLEEGEWEIWEERQRFVVRGGEALLLFRGRHHFGTVPCRSGTRWVYLHFLPADGDRFFQTPPSAASSGMTVQLSSHLSLAGNLQAGQLFRDIMHCFWSSLPHNRQRARVLLSELLIELSRLAQRGGATGGASRVEFVLRHLDAHPEKTFGLDELANLAHMSRRLLTREFRKATGRSIRRYQLEQKVRIAQSLALHNPGVRLKELAHTLGFYDEFHFSKTFKRLAGKCLSAARRGSVSAANCRIK